MKINLKRVKLEIGEWWLMLLYLFVILILPDISLFLVGAFLALVLEKTLWNMPRYFPKKVKQMSRKMFWILMSIAFICLIASVIEIAVQ
jgi:hypothetical protein